jgi:16S rRNA (uracil1498-N3)-methyltransferase
VAAHAFVDDLAAPALAEVDRHHLERVLRLRAGEVVTVSDGRGRWRACRFATGGQLEVDGAVVVEPAPAPALTIGFALVKGERPEWVVQKLTEVGVDRIVVLHTARSVVRWDAGDDRAARRLERLARVAREAAMQSHRAWLPAIEGPVGFGSAAAWPGACLADAGAAGGPSLARPSVLVGPEGGWTDEELGAGLPSIRLGPHVLRTETAAVAAGTLLSALRESLV